LKSSQYKCSECGKPGHNSRNCPKNKKKSKSGHSSKCKSGSSSKHKSKKKGSVNIATRKGKSSPNKIPKSRKTKQKGVATSSRGRAPLQSRPLGDESEIQDSVSSSNHKSQNKSTTLEQNIHRILLDMLEKEDETLEDPMEIDFVIKKEPTTIATIPCKIKHLKIPAMTLDSAAQPVIVTNNIVKCVGGKIDKSEIYDLSGIATDPTESIGVIRNLPITFPPGFTIYEDFVVVKYKKPTLIFSNPLLKKYKCAIDWAKDELKIPFNGKDHIIPITMHNVKNNLK
ncbi:14737_t:CDS:2, partial [Entrophospora sp. SA101]